MTSSERPESASSSELRVGPKGYIHGWIFVGNAGLGLLVQHAHHGKGRIVDSGHEHVQVKFHEGPHAGQTLTFARKVGSKGAPRIEPAEKGHEKGWLTSGKSVDAAKEWIDKNAAKHADTVALEKYSGHTNEAHAVKERLNEHYKATLKTHAAAIHAYTDGSYHDINSAARAGHDVTKAKEGYYGPGVDASTAMQVKRIDKSMKGLPENITLTRTVSSHNTNALNGVAAGDIISDPGFSSTTVVPGSFGDPDSPSSTTLHIIAPKGTPASWAEPHTNYPGEYEAILSRNQPLIVLSARHDVNTGTHITAIAVPHSLINPDEHAAGPKLTSVHKAATAAAKKGKAAPDVGGVKAQALPTSPEDFAGMEKINGPQGSQGGQWYRSPDGSTYYVKNSVSPSNEVGTARVYELAGLTPGKDIPNIAQGFGEFDSKVVSERIPGLQKLSAEQWKDPAKQEAVKKFFAVSVLTSNYDAAGQGLDNMLWNPATNSPVMVDAGAGMAKRAMGGDKLSWNVNGKLMDEVQALSGNGSHPNSDLAAIFGGMSNAEKAAALKDLLIRFAGPAKQQQLRDAFKSAGMSPATIAKNVNVIESRLAQIPGVISALSK